MLIRNESRMMIILDIKLVFDDNTTRELQVKQFDCVQVSYRKNGCVRCGTGIIREIEPYIKHNYDPVCCCNKHSARITLDMSSDHVACVEKIDLYDIIDIRQVSLEDAKPGFTDSDFTVTGACCMTGCPNKDKEVVIRD